MSRTYYDDLGFFLTAASTDLRDAFSASFIVDFCQSLFEANRLKFRTNPANTFHSRALIGTRDLALHDIGEQLRQFPEGHPLRKLEYSRDIMNHRDYIGHRRLKITPWKWPRMQEFADKGRGDLDLKGALVWRFWNGLFRSRRACWRGRAMERKRSRPFASLSRVGDRGSLHPGLLHRHWGVAQSNSY